MHAKTSERWTLPHCACSYDHAEVAKALLEKGADVHAKDSRGHTPLFVAYEKGLNDDIAEILWENGGVYN